MKKKKEKTIKIRNALKKAQWAMRAYLKENTN